MELAALRLAIDVLHMPSQVRRVREEALPDGMGLLLEIAAGDRDSVERAGTQLKRPREVVDRAAAFFIEQVLLAPDADSYRVLGAPSDAPATDLRRNMALLIRCLHPDRAVNGDRAIFTGRVTKAWDDLKTAERRDVYDRQRDASRPKAAVRGAASSRGSGNQRPGKLRGGPIGWLRQGRARQVRQVQLAGRASEPVERPSRTALLLRWLLIRSMRWRRP